MLWEGAEKISVRQRGSSPQNLMFGNLISSDSEMACTLLMSIEISFLSIIEYMCDFFWALADDLEKILFVYDFKKRRPQWKKMMPVKS